MKDIEAIQNLVGVITEQELRYVDSFVCDKMGIFIPTIGPCMYAVTPGHSHPSYSFVLTHDTFCRVDYEGLEVQSLPKKMYATAPGIVHHEIVEGDFSRYIAIFIEPHFFEEEFLLYNEGNPPNYRGTMFDLPTGITAIIKEFMLEYENQMAASKSILKAIALRITHCIIREQIGNDFSKEKISSRFDIDRVVEYLHLNYAEKISVDDMANLINFSPSHFAHLFKKEIGKSPFDYLQKVRLNNARRLLRLGEKNITEVAYDCGFGSSSHFSSSFRREFQISPSSFQKSFQIAESCKTERLRNIYFSPIHI